ncbi:hypothetical protein NMY22_g16874 [Coprinellus aureogranulatus]|nr:hypothetical protein NMY22_g16874 [Coprinellus aureogranulatus]
MYTAPPAGNQLANMRLNGIDLANCAITGGDVLKEFRVSWETFSEEHGLIVPSGLPEGITNEEKVLAAKKRFLCLLIHYARDAVCRVNHRHLPLLSYHLADLPDLIFSPEKAKVANAKKAMSSDIEMGDPLITAFDSLSMMTD